MVSPLGQFHKALILSSVLAACGGSALEGGREVSETDGAIEVGETEVEAEVVDSEIAETEVDAEVIDVEVETEVGPIDWTPVSLGDEGVIDDLVLVSDTLGFAASGARVLRWDGVLWAAYGEPGGAVHGVWSDGALVVAVGDGVARRSLSNDEGWQVMAGAPAVTLRAVSGRGPADLFVAGDEGTVAHWDGSAWRTVFTRPGVTLNALHIVAGSSGDAGVYAVGSGGTLVTLNAAGAWAAAAITFQSTVLEDVAAVDGTLFAVGTGHTVTAKAATSPTWIGQVTNDARERDLAALASADGMTYIFGADGVVLVRAGNGWNLETAATQISGLTDFGVSDAVPGHVMALARGGDGIALDGTWSTIATMPEATLTAFARRGAEVWAVGGKGFVARRDAQGWSILPSGTRVDLHGIAANAAGELVAVGDDGTILRIDASDMVEVVDNALETDLFAVVATEDGFVACGRGGVLLTIDDAVTPIPAGTNNDLRAIEVGGDGALWVAGVFGTLVRIVDAPVLITSGVGGALSGLAPTSDGVYVVGDNGVILRARAAGATIEHEAPGAFLYDVDVSSTGIAVAAGASGLVLVKRGEAWVDEGPSERGATFDAVYVAPDGSEAIVAGAFKTMYAETRVLPLVTP